jgi:hypothetical protein
MKNNKPIYNNSELSKTWSEHSYAKYKDNKNTWKWEHLPVFNERQNLYESPRARIDGSILEVGSAAGGAYNFLLSQNSLGESHDYSGYDISEMGHEYCKENYPGAEWHLADLTQTNFDREYEYSFERIAVHHMPSPLEIFSQMMSVTRKSFACTFTSCINGDTISDLSLARYRFGGGEYVYFNIINVFEVMELMVSLGFKKIDLIYGGEHEPVEADPLAHQYVSPEINLKERLFGRTTLIGCKNQGEIDANLVTPPAVFSPGAVVKKLLGESKHIQVIKQRLKGFNNRTYGVLYKSIYQNY